MRTQMSGVTLLELMTAIAVLAVLAAVGVPAFTDIVRNNQIAAGSNGLMQALVLARSEALTRGKRVSVCAANANSCAADDDAAWQNGWIVFEDDFGATGVIDGSDVILQKWSAPENGVQIAKTDDESAVTFTRNARAEFEASFTVEKSGCKGEQQREISVSFSGRVALTRKMCSAD